MDEANGIGSSLLSGDVDEACGIAAGWCHLGQGNKLSGGGLGRVGCVCCGVVDGGAFAGPIGGVPM